MTDRIDSTASSDDLHRLLSALPVSDQAITRPPFRPVADFQRWLRSDGRAYLMRTPEELARWLASGDLTYQQASHAVWRLRRLLDAGELA